MVVEAKRWQWKITYMENIMKDSVHGNYESGSSDDDDDDDDDDNDDDDDDGEEELKQDNEEEKDDEDDNDRVKNMKVKTDDYWVQEINCLEWENFAFHSSPLIILVFKGYNSLWCLKLLFHIASDNWKLLKELEEAIKVYWNAKDRLPPRAVKIDINIKRDLAYALKFKGCPQILFLRGHGVVYRKKGFTVTPIIR
ncbi:hypothetical protein Ahy_B10g106519 [Arachis hypogaea]|uniref:Thioredoxin domain-containing protein n=1 Tax=Arachis hypogaea TaxID=3818 RepID=A0A444XB43_ARAHY|nr:hypothetical protein Ahy_B10g106519 [Arachis hypogaea]